MPANPPTPEPRATSQAREIYAQQFERGDWPTMPATIRTAPWESLAEINQVAIRAIEAALALAKPAFAEGKKADLIANLERLKAWCRDQDGLATIWLHIDEAIAALVLPKPYSFLPDFDVTKPINVDQDGALAVYVLNRFATGIGPFVAGDANRVIEAIQRLRLSLPKPCGPSEGPFPAQIGRLGLGEKLSDGDDRHCSARDKIMSADHPVYWPERIGEYPDDIDPYCIGCAIEKTEGEQGWCEKCDTADLTPAPLEGDWVAVPRVPTREMWAAGGDAVVGYKQRHHDKVVESVWSEMLAAAPSTGDGRAMRSALERCRDQFAFYAREHTAAGKHEKAATNQRFADLATAALTPAPAAEDGWQPIASAPKDGKPILVFVPDEDFASFTGIDLVWFDGGWLYGQADNYPGKPTHWMPLPAPPTPTKGEGK